ncbi:MAG: M48 family peptidase [Betaproteobacteria bacterium]|nr:M48 family peptidase [Betaproteobacteria bacterium]
MAVPVLPAPRLAGIGLVAFIALTGCQTVQTTRPGAVGVDRTQRFLISSEEMNRGAADAYRKVLAEAAGKRQLNPDPAQTARVRRIAGQLIPATATFRSDAPKWSWEINVLGSNEVNAWCMHGGKIAVYTGLITRLNASDDELAAVMGHEIAHALREHSREQASQAAAQGLLLSVLGAVAGLSNTTQQLSQLALDVTFNLPHSRTDETEADRIGVELAARAGYDPHAAVTLWEKMGRLAGPRPPQFLSTHPAPENRLKDLQVMAERVMPLYTAAKR